MHYADLKGVNQLYDLPGATLYSPFTQALPQYDPLTTTEYKVCEGTKTHVSIIARRTCTYGLCAVSIMRDKSHYLETSR